MIMNKEEVDKRFDLIKQQIIQFVKDLVDNSVSNNFVFEVCYGEVYTIFKDADGCYYMYVDCKKINIEDMWITEIYELLSLLYRGLNY